MPYWMNFHHRIALGEWSRKNRKLHFSSNHIMKTFLLKLIFLTFLLKLIFLQLEWKFSRLQHCLQRHNYNIRHKKIIKKKFKYILHQCLLNVFQFLSYPKLYVSNAILIPLSARKQAICTWQKFKSFLRPIF